MSPDMASAYVYTHHLIQTWKRCQIWVTHLGTPPNTANFSAANFSVFLTHPKPS